MKMNEIIQIDELTKSGSLNVFLPALINFAKYGNSAITGFNIDREREIIFITKDGEDIEFTYDMLYNSEGFKSSLKENK